MCYLISKVSLCPRGVFIFFFPLALETNYSTGPPVIQLHHCITIIYRCLMVYNVRTGGQKDCSNSPWIVFHTNYVILFLEMPTSQCMVDFLFSFSLFHQNNWKVSAGEFISNMTLEISYCWLYNTKFIVRNILSPWESPI